MNTTNTPTTAHQFFISTRPNPDYAFAFLPANSEPSDAVGRWVEFNGVMRPGAMFTVAMAQCWVTDGSWKRVDVAEAMTMLHVGNQFATQFIPISWVKEPDNIVRRFRHVNSSLPVDPFTQPPIVLSADGMCYARVDGHYQRDWLSRVFPQTADNYVASGHWVEVFAPFDGKHERMTATRVPGDQVLARLGKTVCAIIAANPKAEVVSGHVRAKFDLVMPPLDSLEDIVKWIQENYTGPALTTAPAHPPTSGTSRERRQVLTATVECSQQVTRNETRYDDESGGREYGLTLAELRSISDDCSSFDELLDAVRERLESDASDNPPDMEVNNTDYGDTEYVDSCDFEASVQDLEDVLRAVLDDNPELDPEARNGDED